MRMRMKDRRNLLFPLSPSSSLPVYSVSTVFLFTPRARMRFSCDILTIFFLSLVFYFLAPHLPSLLFSCSSTFSNFSLFTFTCSSRLCHLSSLQLLVTRQKQNLTNLPFSRQSFFFLSLFRQSLLAFHFFFTFLCLLLPLLLSLHYTVRSAGQLFPPDSVFFFLLRVQVPRHYKMRQHKPCYSRYRIVNSLKMIEQIECIIE